MSRVLKLSCNEVGRDFIVGDIHGAYDLVLRAMDRAGFDPAVDRLFSVGDLIDRGAGSRRCVKFLAQPYVHAVMGNHEAMLLDLYADGEPHQFALDWQVRRNGLGWWLKLDFDERRQVLDAIRDLPLVIEVETLRGTVGILHADVPANMHWEAFLAAVERGDLATVETALEGRDRIKGNNCDGVAGVGRVFVGHTPQWQGLRQFGNIYAIDTGAVFGERQDGKQQDAAGHLTMAAMLAQTSVIVAPRPPVQLIDLRDGPVPSTPFGSYAR